tara:strand:- start:599 stop:3868 length:3270 start_codon:yes stop_codon:yes gene_type:complete
MSKVQPDIQSYIDTQLIECSRLRSIEYNASDNNNKPALFTNTQSNGIQIEEGDKISVNSAYVSEIGAGGEVIEILGKKTGKQMTIEYTNTSNTVDVDFSPLGYNPYPFNSSLSYLMDNSHTKKQALTTIETKTFDITDNKIFFTNSYYKTSNGEGYFHLPRRFATSNLLEDIEGIYDAIPSGTPNAIDGTALRIATYMCNTWVPNYFINATANNQISPDAYGEVYSNMPEWYSMCRADHQLSPFVYGNPLTTTLYPPHLVKKNDNSKYKIYRREATIWFPNEDDTDGYKDVMTPDDKGRFLRDIAMNVYHPVNDLQSIELDTGFDTPQNIAQSITEQLNTTTERDIGVYAFNTSAVGLRGASLTAGYKNIELKSYSRLTETPLFKAFETATESSLIQDNSRAFFSGAYNSGSGIAFTSSTSDARIYNQGTLNYFNSFHHIGVKRPEIYDAGCKFNGDRPDYAFQQLSQKVVNDVNGVDIITNLAWDEINKATGNYFLDDLKDLFDAQGLYPELFDYYFSNGLVKSDDISVDTKRFLHINETNTSDTQLGWDNWGYVNSASSLSDTPLDATINGKTSLPLFVDYDKSQKDNLDKQKYGWNNNDKWGGYFFRGTDSLGVRQNYISVRFSLVTEYDVGGITVLFNASNEIESGRPIGFDMHFSAYGNSMIALHSGKTMFNWADVGATNYMRRDISTAPTVTQENATPSLSLFEDLGGRLYANGFDKFQFLYIGALNPVINFDTVSNRFAFGGLSSPEYSGNYVDAGDEFTNNIHSTKNTNPQQEVYFINKRLKKNSYSPSLVPYNSYRSYPANKTWTVAPPNPYATDVTYEIMNPLLEEWIVYDTHSGIVWNDFGSDKLNWTSNSMFGILGFDYDILHPKNPSNYQTVFNVNTANPNTNGITTNSLVKNTDILAQTQNRSGAPYYNYTMAYTVGYNIIGGHYQRTINHPAGSTGIGWVSADKRETGLDLPQIAQDTTTAFIRASNLPRKTNRPYYLIRSNIIAQDSFIASLGNRLPIVAVVSKVNGYADYYTKDEEGVEFTATKPFTINSITTSIHNPDGTLAKVSDNSAIIYKVKKSKNITLNLSDVVLDM